VISVYKLHSVPLAMQADVEALGALSAKPDSLLLDMDGQTPRFRVFDRKNHEFAHAESLELCVAIPVCAVSHFWWVGVHCAPVRVLYAIGPRLVS
jgi:hypothetical protein